MYRTPVSNEIDRYTKLSKVYPLSPVEQKEFVRVLFTQAKAQWACWIVPEAKVIFNWSRSTSIYITRPSGTVLMVPNRYLYIVLILELKVSYVMSQKQRKGSVGVQLERCQLLGGNLLTSLSTALEVSPYRVGLLLGEESAYWTNLPL